MDIEIDILLAWGGIKKKYPKNALIFQQDELAKNYFQIVEGKVKMYSLNEEGKELIQGIFTDGHSFGEPPLFINEKYPSTACAMQDAIVIRLPKDFFFEMLDNYPVIQRKMMQILARKAFTKACSARDIINLKPEIRIKNFLDTYKVQQNQDKGKVLIPYTRQEIADCVGLRVETVIRTLKQMQREQKLEITKHKIYY
jgi:CRP-like cAMP-binding protein